MTPLINVVDETAMPASISNIYHKHGLTSSGTKQWVLNAPYEVSIQPKVAVSCCKTSFLKYTCSGRKPMYSNPPIRI